MAVWGTRAIHLTIFILLFASTIWAGPIIKVDGDGEYLEKRKLLGKIIKSIEKKKPSIPKPTIPHIKSIESTQPNSVPKISLPKSSKNVEPKTTPAQPKSDQLSKKDSQTSSSNGVSGTTPKQGKSDKPTVQPGRSHEPSTPPNGPSKKASQHQATSTKESKTKKGRCNSKHSKRSGNGFESCEEYNEHNVKPLTDSKGAPKVASDNPNTWFASKKMKYTDSKQREPLVQDGKVNEKVASKIGSDQAKAQNQHYANEKQKVEADRAKPKDQREGLSKPYRDPPGGLGMMIEPDALGKGVHGIRLSTSMVTKKNNQATVPTIPQEVKDVRTQAGSRRGGQDRSGLHIEEINGSQRVHDRGPGTAPFQGTHNAAWETKNVNNPQQAPEAMRACQNNCRPMLKAGQGEDMHRTAGPTASQQESSEAKRARKDKQQAELEDTATSQRRPSVESQPSSSTSSTTTHHKQSHGKRSIVLLKRWLDDNHEFYDARRGQRSDDLMRRWVGTLLATS